MLKEKGFYKRFVKVGPGGFKCECCWPQTSKGHKEALRSFRWDEKRFIARLVKEALE